MSQTLTASRPQARRTTLLLGGVVLLGALAVVSLAFGSISIDPQTVFTALWQPSSEVYEHTVVTGLRLPRTIFAILVGAGLGVGGAVMQAITRNPLADPFVFGLSNGAGLAITCAVFFLGLRSPAQFIWFAFIGALGAAALVYLIGRGAGPVRMVLAGVITSTLMGTWTSVLIYTDRLTRETVRHVFIGSVAGRSIGDFWLPLVIIAIGTLILVRFGCQLNVLNLGEDAARAAGMQTGQIRLICTALVVIITGAAVAAAGPIGFVGFAVAHMVRGFTGGDYRWILPGSAIGGAGLLLVADLIGRVALFPAELEASIVMGVLGAPFFVLIARRRTVTP